MPSLALIAPDTNVLIDLAEKHETVLDCFATFKKRLSPIDFYVLPSVIQELAYLANHGGTERQRKSSHLALKSILHPWKFKPITVIPVGHGIAEQIALKLRKGHLLPEEEITDSLVIAEAALANITILLSNDAHIKDIDRIRLKEVLAVECHVGVPIIVSPWHITKSFFQ